MVDMTDFSVHSDTNAVKNTDSSQSNIELSVPD
jgi:hypothetical protein